MATVLVLLVSACASPTEMLSSPLSSLNTPKAILERAVEARSVEAIAQDTAIYVAATKALVSHGALSINAEVYEGNLLVTGLIGTVDDCPPLKDELEKIEGVQRLYWHVLCAPRHEQRAAGAIGDFKRMLLRTKVAMWLVGEAEVADVNYRIGVDSMRSAVLMGRARSGGERDAAVKAAHGDGIRTVIAYIDVRP